MPRTATKNNQGQHNEKEDGSTNGIILFFSLITHYYALQLCIDTRCNSQCRSNRRQNCQRRLYDELLSILILTLYLKDTFFHELFEVVAGS